jgi:hypothetical protein
MSSTEITPKPERVIQRTGGCRRFSASDFEGTQVVTSLPVYPFHMSELAIDREILLDHGREFIQCTKVGVPSILSFMLEPEGKKLCNIGLGNVSVYSELIGSAVIVDFEHAIQEVPTWRPESEDVKN